jgi:hypothetical protein
MAKNGCCIEYADTWWLKKVHWLSKSHSMDGSTTNHRWETLVESDSRGAWACLPIMRIHMWVDQVSKLQW